jgi:hypothetical protein
VAVSTSPTGKSAARDPSPAKGLLRRGFLLRQRSNLADISSGNERLPLALEPEPVLVPDLALDLDPILDPNPSLAHILNPSESSDGLYEGAALEKDLGLDPVSGWSFW